jgi:penicillin-binding protein 1A
VPEDRHEPQRAPTLPDEVVYWLAALGLAVTTAVRLLLLVDATVGRFLAGTAWPAVRRTGDGAAAQVAGLARRAARAVPIWAAARRTRLALWVGSGEVAGRRAIRGARRGAGAGVAAVGRSPFTRRWARRATAAGALAVALAAGLVVASDPLLSGVAQVTIGDDALDQLSHLSQTSVVAAADGPTLGVVERERRRVVDIDALPEHVTAVVLAAEDHRFEDHEGYDLTGLARAAVTNARSGEVEQGGSTITQQLAKLNFTGDDPSISRKVEELLYAVRLEDQLSKEQLLARYLNQVYFGNGAHGIAAAAEEYFGVAPEDLSPAQAATLAGIIQRPSSLDPRQDPERVQRRRDVVLHRAAAEGLLGRGEARAAVAEPLELAPPTPRPRADAILDAVRAEVRGIEELGSTPEARAERLETGGLRVETTLDSTLQHVAAETIAATFPEATGATAAVAAVDPRTGAIRALRGGRAGAGGFDLARQGRRQPGSTFKPLTAVAALERGLSTEQGLVGDGPIELEHDGPEPWRVDNFEGADLGTVDLRAALRHSVNTAFAQLGVAVGPAAVADVAERIGIDPDAALGDPDQRGPSVALGGVAHGVSPLELASAYTTFATGGRWAEPHLVRRILDADGRVVFEREPRPAQVIEPEVADTVRAMLEGALEEGTGRAARIDDVAAFGKTGTSQDGADAWFVGSTTDLTTAVWVGHPDGRVAMPEATGGRLAAPIWRMVTSAWAEAHPPGSWPPPDDDLDSAPGLPLPRPERVR